jgi:ComEC/Rec2-related protein
MSRPSGIRSLLERITPVQRVSLIFLAAGLAGPPLATFLQPRLLIVVGVLLSGAGLAGAAFGFLYPSMGAGAALAVIFPLSLSYAVFRDAPVPVPLDTPVYVRMKIVSYPDYGEEYPRYTARVLRVEVSPRENRRGTDGEGIGRTLRFRVLCGLPRGADVHRGDRVDARGVFLPLPSEPGDYRHYLRSRGVRALLEVPRGGIVEVGEAGGLSPLRLSTGLHRAVSSVNRRLLPYPHGEFAVALLTGDRRGMPKGMTDAFRRSGTMHILAVSGLHVGFIGLFLFFPLRMCRVDRIAASLCLAAVFLFFMVFVGDAPSVRRASLMAVCGIVCFLLDRDRNYMNVLALVFCFLWITNPRSVTNPGFLLSFTATFGILLVMPRLYPLMRRVLPDALAGPITVTLAVQLFLFPVMTGFFGEFAYVNLIANIPIVPLTGLSLALDLLLLLLYPMALPLAVVLAETNTLVIVLIMRLAAFIANAPPLAVSFPRGLIPVYLAGMTVLVLWLWPVRAPAQAVSRPASGPAETRNPRTPSIR